MNRWHSLIAVLLLLIVLVYGYGFACKWEHAVKSRDWVKCGKPWGEPCDCPKGLCRCGLNDFSTCKNCRPMGE